MDMRGRPEAGLLNDNRGCIRPNIPNEVKT